MFGFKTKSAFPILIAVCVLGHTACSREKKPHPGFEEGPLGLSSSIEQLMEKAVAGLNGKNDSLLRRLSFDEAQYQVIYPYMKNADTNRPALRDAMYQLYAMGNEKYLSRWIADHGGKALTFSRYLVEGPMQANPRYALHRGVRIFVKDKDSKEIELPLFRTLVEIDGGWKVYRYAED